MTRHSDADVIVIGSGAGGSVTAYELARAGRDVLVLEEGRRHTPDEYGRRAPDAMRLLYRRRGMTPIMGSVPIGYVEGRCVGGSTEINSGFWHRTPPEILLRWKAQLDLADATSAELEPHFQWAERLLSVRLHGQPFPASTEIFRRGIERMGWSAMEVPRMIAQPCDCRTPCASGCRTGAKQSMSRSLLPQAEAAGARVLTGCRARRLVRRDRRVDAVLVARERDDGSTETVELTARYVFVCGGPTETPALLRRSGVTNHVGHTLALHPMLKVAARFPQAVHADRFPIPLLQVKEFWPEVSLGGAFMSHGHLAMHLSENWPSLANRLADADRMAMFYVAVRGSGRGSVRPGWQDDATYLRYELSDEDHLNLSRGMSRLATLLLEAGADEVYPCVQGLPVITTQLQSVRWLDERLPKEGLSLTTVHAFSACPIGERADKTAADSYGKVHGHENLFINDASMLHDSPGVNPQGSIMALARRNAQHFADRSR